MHALLLTCCALCFQAGQASAPTQHNAPPIPAADPAIKEETLSKHVHALASDEMRGRMTGSPEAKRAAQYLADVLAQSGIAPAVDGNSYFQRVPLIAYSFESNPSLTVEETDGTTWTAEQGPDFRLRIKGAPDGEARLALCQPGDLPSGDKLHGTALFLPGKRTKISDKLTELHLDQGQGLGLLLLEGSHRQGRARTMRPRGLTSLPAGRDPADQVIANGRLLESLQAGKVKAVSLHTQAVIEDRSCQNVVGILHGAGTKEHPELAQEVIVLSAHYDHLGVDSKAEASQKSDSTPRDFIYNGADDDASGVAAVLEIAEAIAAGEPPARTLLVFLATGEERGLLGTLYYLDDPVIPLDDTTYNLNLEMIGRPDPLLAQPGDLWLTGWDETTLGPALAGKDQPVSRDPRPKQNFYQRSDNIAFVRRGIMGQTLSSYGMHTDYHHVTDEADLLDYEHMQIATQNAYRVAHALLVDALRIDWGKK